MGYTGRASLGTGAATSQLEGQRSRVHAVLSRVADGLMGSPRVIAQRQGRCRAGFKAPRTAQDAVGQRRAWSLSLLVKRQVKLLCMRHL